MINSCITQKTGKKVFSKMANIIDWQVQLLRYTKFNGNNDCVEKNNH